MKMEISSFDNANHRCVKRNHQTRQNHIKVQRINEQCNKQSNSSTRGRKAWHSQWPIYIPNSSGHDNPKRQQRQHNSPCPFQKSTKETPQTARMGIQASRAQNPPQTKTSRETTKAKSRTLSRTTNPKRPNNSNSHNTNSHPSHQSDTTPPNDSNRLRLRRPHDR